MFKSSADGWVFLNVLKGINTRRSSSPMPNPPLGFSTTPITWKSVPSIMTSLPMGWPSGKSTGKDVMIDGTDFQVIRSEEHTSELQSHLNLVCRLLLEKKNTH